MCTAVRFSNEEGSVFLGRNLDWSCGYGENVRIMPKGFMIPWAYDESIPAKHAVIGMCVEFQNYPLFFDCGNDAGLAVAGLNHPGCAEYAPNPVESKTNIAAYEFPAWVAANFENVDEVEAALANSLIIEKPFNEHFPVSYLHWIIGDATRSIVVESRADGLHVFDNPVDVLANHPNFEWHLTNLRTYITATPTVHSGSHTSRRHTSTIAVKNAAVPALPSLLAITTTFLPPSSSAAPSTITSSLHATTISTHIGMYARVDSMYSMVSTISLSASGSISFPKSVI